MEPKEYHVAEAIAAFQLAKARGEATDRAIRLAVEAVFKMLPCERRDYFAASALSNMATMQGETYVTDPDCAARAAYAYADAMMATRK